MGPRSQRRSDLGPPPRAGAAVARFMLGSLAAVAVVVLGGVLALRSVARDEAENDTRDRVVAEGRLVEAAGLQDAIVDGDPAALRRLDDLVVGQILGGSIVRVKLWSRDGRILYSDEPSLIGRRFGLGEDSLELFRTGGAEAELSDLSKPENRLERPQGELLEAHTVIRTPDGTQVLFEIYERRSSVDASARRLLRAMAPPLVAGLIVLLLSQIPLAWSLARRLQRGHHERERLLATAVEASATERSRIAADLHDGVVQDLAGVAFGLAPLADEARQRGDEAAADALRTASGTLRQGVRDLRTLLVEIHPPNLETAGLEVALSDLLSPLAAAGLQTRLDIDEAPSPGLGHDTLAYRVVREALRNVQQHAGATSVQVEVRRPTGGGLSAVVRDDGRGFSPAQRQARGGAGHLGLSLLESVVTGAGGRLQAVSAPGEGTTVELDLPARLEVAIR